MLPSEPVIGQNHRFSVEVEDPHVGTSLREYILHLPASYDASNDQPVPLMMDFHGWTGSAADQMDWGAWTEVADTDETGFIYVAMEGMNDVENGGSFGSWNVSRSDGPLGPPCEVGLHTGYPIYKSCGTYEDVDKTCDWTSCYDDVTFVQVALYQITSIFCVDLNSIHMSGMSNGGMFMYSRVLESLSAAVASVGPVSGSPLRGFNPMPDTPVNIIDFHGLHDEVIPYSPEQANNLGAGPDGTTEANDGWYYLIKLDHLKAIMASMNCDPQPRLYPTHMDGNNGWACNLWDGCDNGKEVVHCHGNYHHEYPFHHKYVEGIKILWNFMKTHSKFSRIGKYESLY